MSSYDKKEEKKFGAVPALDLSALNAMYSNPAGAAARKGPDYIAFNTRGRDFYGRLSFNTGILWLGGFAAGGMYGFVEGWKSAASPNYKIRINSVMNGLTRRGSVAGSTLGIIGQYSPSAFSHVFVLMF
jgi:hypothetical protein